MESVERIPFTHHLHSHNSWTDEAPIQLSRWRDEQKMSSRAAGESRRALEHGLGCSALSRCWEEHNGLRGFNTIEGSFCQVVQRVGFLPCSTGSAFGGLGTPGRGVSGCAWRFQAGRMQCLLLPLHFCLLIEFAIYLLNVPSSWASKKFL